MHFIGPDQLHGFNERITTDIYPSNFAWTPDWIAGERYRPTGINMRAVVDAGVMARRDNVKFIYTHGHPDLMYDLDGDPLELDNLIGRAEYDAIERDLREEILRGWDPDRVHHACIQSQRDRLFIHRTTGGEPGYAYEHRSGDGQRYVRNASAVGAKARARYPFVEPTPFAR